MKIIDSHAHIFPEKIAQKAGESISDFYNGTEMHHVGTADALLESGKKIGVEKYVVFSSATKAEQVESINNFIDKTCRQHPEFIGLGTMHRDYPAYTAELERIAGLGMPGVKLHPDFQKFCIDDEKMFPIYDVLSELGLFVLTHSGDYRYDFSHPTRIARVAKAFPKLRIIAAHFGGWQQWDAAIEHLNLPNVYYDTSSTIPFIGNKPAIRALNKLDRSHFFFGTDFPMWDHQAELERIFELQLPEQLLEDILYNNFVRFLENK